MNGRKIKNALKSKFFWFGVLFVVNSIAGLFGFGEWKPSPELLKTTSGLIGVIILILRFKTKEPIQLRLK